MERTSTTPAVNRGSKYEIQQGHYTNVVDQFKNAMMDAGIAPPDNIIGDGRLHRFKIDGKLNGAYVLHLDGRPAGYFQDFKQGIKLTWKQSGKFIPLSEFQRQALAEQRQREQAERKAEEAAKHKAAASKAAYIWNNAKPAPANHPYLLKKRIGTHGACLGRDNTLVLPLFNASRELVNLQFISETGGKRFLSGGKIKGCFVGIGMSASEAAEPGRILICEGFATGASLHEWFQQPVIVAFNAGNLELVAKRIRALYPSHELIICGDNDESGTGQKAAREAALAIGGKYIIPPIVGTDFNDAINTWRDAASMEARA